VIQHLFKLLYNLNIKKQSIIADGVWYCKHPYYIHIVIVSHASSTDNLGSLCLISIMCIIVYFILLIFLIIEIIANHCMYWRQLETIAVVVLFAYKF
jgi:hypothetical protein